MLGKEVGETVVRITRKPGLVLLANSEVTAQLDWLRAMCYQSCACTLLGPTFPVSMHSLLPCVPHRGNNINLVVLNFIHMQGLLGVFSMECSFHFGSLKIDLAAV